MFQKQFQKGACVEVFSAQEKSPLAHWNVSGIKKLFDKEVKSFVYVLDGTAEKSKMQLPKDTKQGLSLLQNFLVFQVYVPVSKDFTLDLSVADRDTKRRLALSTAFKETRVNPIHCQIPLGFIKRAMWLNLCVDMPSLMSEAWSDTLFSSLEGIAVSGSCKLRRIFTMRRQAPDTTDDDEVYGVEVNTDVELESIPKHCLLPTEVAQLTQVANWLKVRHFESKSAQSEANLSLSTSPAKHNIAFSNKPASHQSSVERKMVNAKQDYSKQSADVGRGRQSLVSHVKDSKSNSDINANADPEFCVDKDGVDGKESVPFVHPHPPQVPSTQRRRRPCVKSAGRDKTPATGARDGSVLEPAELSAQVDAEVDSIIRAVRVNSESESEPNSHNESHGAAEGSDESISDVISSLKHSKNNSRVYTFSSPPTVIEAPRIRVSPPRLVDAAKNSEPDSPLQPVSKDLPVTDDSGTECELESSQITPVSISLATLGSCSSDNEKLLGATTSQLSPLPLSVRRSSLREIPEDEIRRSGGEKPYNFAKYKNPDDELSQSFEQQMLLEMKRDAAMCSEEADGVDSGNHNHTLLNSQLRFGEDPPSDSSDEDTSTFKSPKYFPKHRPSYDYQEEIANLGRRFLGSSHAGEWESPRIASSTATLNSSRDQDTMEIPQLSFRMGVPSQPTIRGSRTNNTPSSTQEDEELDLLFDTQLQCFYDPKTCKYYKLIM